MSLQNQQSEVADAAVEQLWEDFDVTGRDVILAVLVDSMNRSTGELSITLSVSGNVISGDLIGMKEFFTLCSERVKAAEIQENPDTANEKGSLSTYLKEVIVDPEDIQNPPHYIHLKDARYITSKQSIPNIGMLWRGRMSEVSGWSLGKIVFNANKSD